MRPGHKVAWATLEDRSMPNIGHFLVPKGCSTRFSGKCLSNRRILYRPAPLFWTSQIMSRNAPLHRSFVNPGENCSEVVIPWVIEGPPGPVNFKPKVIMV